MLKILKMKPAFQSTLSLAHSMLALSMFLDSHGHCAEVIFTPGSVQAAKQLQALYPRSKPIFNASEKKALFDMGESELAASRKMDVPEKALLKIKRHLQRNLVDVDVQLNAPVRTQSTSGFDLNWALNNLGGSQKVAVDDLTSLTIPAKKYEDVGLQRLSTDAISRLSKPKKNITVAVLDTGIDWAHPELAPSIDLHVDECKALSDFTNCLKNGKTDDDKKQCSKKYLTLDLNQNGYPLDCRGWNFVVPGAAELQGLGSPELTDDVGHGTHVAGMVKALAPLAKILPVKVIRSQPNAPIRPQSVEEPPQAPKPNDPEVRSAQGFTDTVARGMLYAIRSGVDVINLSLAWPEAVESELFEKMLTLAEKRGIIVVAAAGNDSTESRVYPCQHTSVVCVASHGPDGALSHFSNFGSFVDIAAPGLNIISTWPTAKRSITLTGVPGFETKNGTSMAAPQVAGALAALLSLGMTVEEAKARILVSASMHRPVPPATYPNPAHITKWVRSGNLDLAKALEQIPAPLITPSEKQIFEIPFTVAQNNETLAGTEIKMTFELFNRWAPSAATEIKASLFNGADMNVPLSSEEGMLSTDTWAEKNWGSREKRSFSTSLRIKSHSISGRLSLKIAITSQANWISAKHTAYYTIPIELTHVIGPTEINSLQKLTVIDASGHAAFFDDTWDMRSVRRTSQDYLAIRSKQNGETQIALLVQDASKNQMQVTGPVDLKFTPGSELLIVDSLPSGETALVLRVPPTDPSAKNPIFQFRFFDSQLKPTRMLEHDNDITVVDERFQWFKTDEGLVPAWIGFGKFPKSEKPKATPWEPTPKDPMASRLYYLSKIGLRSATSDFKQKPAQMWIQLLNQNLVSGALDIFVGTGRDYQLTYERVKIEYDLDTNTPVIRERTSLIQPEYRNLLGKSYRDEKPTGDASLATTVATGSSSQGKLRLTVIPSRDEGAVLEDMILEAPSKLDTVVASIGTFYSKDASGKIKLAGVFSQTHYEMAYRDVMAKKTYALSLERFSFLPSFIATRSLFPITALTESKQILPALLIPESLGSTHATEVIVMDPQRGLTRPAWLRVRTQEGCEIMGNPIIHERTYPFDQTSTELSLYCRDSFYRFPVEVKAR